MGGGLITLIRRALVAIGAGIAVATTGLALVVSIVLAIVGVVFWPLRWVI